MSEILRHYDHKIGDVVTFEVDHAKAARGEPDRPTKEGIVVACQEYRGGVRTVWLAVLGQPYLEIREERECTPTGIAAIISPNLYDWANTPQRDPSGNYVDSNPRDDGAYIPAIGRVVKESDPITKADLEAIGRSALNSSSYR